jgi:sulfide dehydrogenase [flavocytochrome c] flavoprotein subunit
MPCPPIFQRRRFLKVALGSTLGVAAAASKSSGAPAALELLSRIALPKSSGPRVVIVGGGWSGLTLAKYLRRFHPAFDVVLVDRQRSFTSLPLSNLWLADQISLDFLSHSFEIAANNHGYRFMNAEVLDADRESRQLFTTAGILNYDYLVLAPGIEYDYGRIGVEDPAQQHALKTRYPAGFVSLAELLLIKQNLDAFRGGDFVITVPPGNFRCTAAPYERACMIAAIIQKRALKAKVRLLDANPEIRIKQRGFERAFQQYYPDIIEYESSTEIESVDPHAKTISTAFDDYAFDEAIIYPPIRASRLIERLGLASQRTPQREGDTDPLRYFAREDERVYVVGDARSQPFSKGGQTAHSEARFVAQLIAARESGVEVAWQSPQTMCFSAVRIDPIQSMSIITFYRYDEDTGEFDFDRSHLIDQWSPRIGQASLAWGEGMFRDMFYA